MINALKFDRSTVASVPDPTTESGEIFMFPEALGQNGRPFVLLVEDPPHKTRARHYHHEDVLYVYVQGEHHIEGEGTYRAGDLRWTRAGHAYGPETTGSEGGAWWVVSYGDPIPVNVDSEADAPDAPPHADPEPGRLPHFARPYDWPAVDRAIRVTGGAIVEDFLPEADVSTLNGEIDDYLRRHQERGKVASGSAVYDMFLGHHTVRLHGLVEKLPGAAALIGRPDLVEWAERIVAPVANSVLLNAGELIQIQPGEDAQFPHRDTDSWPALPVGEHPVLVNAIVALDPFTLENGATYVAPESWQWKPNRQPEAHEYARAVMKPGDALLFRGDLVHGGGENASTGRRRALSVSYCAAWLRPVENSFLNVPLATVRQQPPRIQALLGYAAHDATSQRGGFVGLFENGDPMRVLA